MPYPFSNCPDPSAPVPFDADALERRLRGLPLRESFLFPENEVPTHFRRSSVLICFWREAADLRVILTKRAATLSGHPGQMCFPGGQLEPGESFAEAAIRETEEEIGIPRGDVELLGRFDDAWSGAGHLLVPIVGWLDAAPRFVPNPAEVEEVHTPSVRNLMTPEAYSEEEVPMGERSFTNPILEWESGSLYGLSTMLLIEALTWASGDETEHGPTRLESLRSFVKLKDGEEDDEE